MLVVNSTDEEVIIHCSSRIELDKLQNPLIASIDREIKSPPAFRLESEKANATTIRIRIIPNGYIGINQIICHIKNNITFGQPVDLIIGGIEMKKNKFDFRLEKVLDINFDEDSSCCL